MLTTRLLLTGYISTFRLCLAAILCLFFSLAATAQVPDPLPDTYVNDHTQLLTPAQIQDLNEQLYQVEQKTSIQVAILLINELPENMAIEDFARKVGNQWKVGNNYNGVVYVAVLGARRQRLEIARNLEGQIPDATAAAIIDQLVPYLRQQDYYQALATLIAQINYHLGTTEQPITDTVSQNYLSAYEEDIYDAERKERIAFEKEKAKYDHYGNIAIGFIIAGAVGFCIWAWWYKKRYVRKNTVNGVYIGIGSSYYTSLYGTNDSSRSSGGGSSGFGGWGGGGGGGGFSGGGASGSW